jgi:integrase
VRKRVLSDAEIALVWRATEGMSAADSYVRLLLLLGARRCELGEATWDEFDLDNGMWVVPAGRMKSDEAHSIPLPPLATEILRTLLLSGPLPRPGARVFGAAQNYARLKRALDARIRALNGGKALPRFTLHDARRTMRTGLSTIGIAPHIAELCIAHRQRGLARIYDLHRFDAEKRAAFEAWAERVMGIVTPAPAPDGNVVRLRKYRDLAEPTSLE